MTSRRVFLSYRRADCAAHAGWLADTLRHQRAGEVFLDVDTITLGEDFVKRIEREIERCDVVLVLIGREWLTLSGDDGAPRIFDELDWVHLEVKAALEREVAVIPVLVQGASMPRPQQLPEHVRALAYRSGIELSESSWNADVARLVAQLPVAPTGTAAPLSMSSPPSIADVLPVDLGRPGRDLNNREGTDVAVVAAGLAYPDYLVTSGYVCQDDRSFRRGIIRLGFYGSKQIHPEFPRILHRRDHVLFTPETAQGLRDRDAPFDQEVATLITSSFDPGAGLSCRRERGRHYQVLCLSDPADDSTLRLARPVVHQGASAWTQNQRYLRSEALEQGPATTDEL